MPDAATHGRLLVSCPDRPGIVARISSVLYDLGANITESAQHTTDPSGGLFFMRVGFLLPAARNLPGPERREWIARALSPAAEEFSMQWSASFADERKRMGVFVSREDHCLLELLWQQRARDIDAETALVISNHPDHETVAAGMGIPFFHIPVRKESKAAAESRQLDLLKRHSVDFVVLARYMQILSPELVNAYPNRIINIHHSFLPAFAGARPYEQAYGRGVKIIGATAHYVTEELDAGPIIEQDVARIDHSHGVPSMKAVGRSIERTVLARAVKWHVEDRILVYGNKTIVFT